MKHPFDAVEHIFPEELTGLDGQELVSEDTLSETKQDQIYQKVLAKIGPSQTIALPSPKQRTWKKWVAFLIAAVIVVFSSFSVVAEVFHWDYRISNLFKPTEEQMISYQGMNIPVTETVQDKGVSVSFGTAISDGYNLYLPATITPPKDFPENHYCKFLEPSLFIDGEECKYFQIEYPPFYAVSVRDGRFPILIKVIQSEIPLSHKKIDLSFEGLVHSSDLRELGYGAYSYEENIGLSCIDGFWKTSFTIADQQQYMREYHPKQTITYEHHSYQEPFEMTVESVTISPLSFQIILSTAWNPQGSSYSPSENPQPNMCGFKDLKLLFKDGTSLAVNYLAQYPSASYMNRGACLVSTYPDEPPSTKTLTQMDFTLQKFIDINEVEAVIIGDNVIPLT